MVKACVDWTIIALLGLVWIFVSSLSIPLGLIAASWIGSKYTPTHDVSVYVPQVDTTVQLKLYINNPIGRAEYDRQLVIRTPNGTIKYELFADWGGASQVNLYLTEKGQLVIIAATVATYFVSVQPPSIAGKGDLSASDRWTFLGSFARGAGSGFTLVYYPADKTNECIPLLGMYPAEVSSDPSMRPRQHAYKQSC
jgi:hypothetical protein